MWARRILAIVVFILVGSAWRAFDKAMTYESPEKRLTQTLEQAAQELTREKSQKVEGGLRLDRVRALESPPTLHYHYTLVDSVSSELDADIFTQEFSPRAIATYCKTMRWYVEHGVFIRYSFKGNDNVPISVVTITPADCQ